MMNSYFGTNKEWIAKGRAYGNRLCICGASALNHLNRYDLIILDIMMPGIDGFSFCEKIRSMVDCPILFLTAKTMENDITFGLGLGAG